MYPMCSLKILDTDKLISVFLTNLRYCEEFAPEGLEGARLLVSLALVWTKNIPAKKIPVKIPKT
jgi:hypothetical protein